MSSTDATDITNTTSTSSEETKDQLHTKDRVCDYYISARGCIKVLPHSSPSGLLPRPSSH